VINIGSKEKQDRFAYLLCGNQGVFLDLGSREPFVGNNTIFLESLGWTGFLFEIEHEFVEQSKEERKSLAYCVDVTTPEFIETLKNDAGVINFDYISVDVDDSGLDALSNLLENGFTFKCMTFEHDYHKDGDIIRKPSREILERYGYVMLFEDVNNNMNHPSSWEDWWINPKQFPDVLLDYKLSNKHYSICIMKLEEYKND
tara:strand:+ start:3430 stop:4032 length:603 start_codon:yes stop_codon:yes gene_type:complete